MRKLLIAVVIALLCALALMAGCKAPGSDPEEREVTWAWRVIDLSGLGLTDWGLNDVHMVSASEGWAVGRRQVEGYLPVVLHYHNGAWTEDNPVDDIPALDGQLYGVNVAPNGEVWCVGTDSSGSAVIIIRSAAGAWEMVAAREGWPTQLRSVTFDSSGNAVVAGGTRILQFDGHTEVAGRTIANSALNDITWVGHGFVVGEETNSALAGIWEGPAYDSNRTAATGVLLGIDLASDGSGWAVGSSGGAPLLVPHSASGGWGDAETVAVGDELKGVSMVSSVEGWAVGYEGDLGEPSQGLLLLWQSGAWSDQSADIRALGIAGSWGLNAVSALSTLETWAVGTNNTAGTGLILHYGPQ